MGERHAVLIVGAGSIGERHLRCFGATDRVQLSLCEVNDNLAHTVALRYGVKETFAHLDEALRSQPDSVVICTPANLHIAMAHAAVEAGAHVLIEKPLSTRLDGIAALQETIRKQQRMAAVAYVLRAHPALAAMRDAIRSGRFGNPVQVVGTSGQNFPYYRPAYRETYYADRKTGGGAVQDALTHVINAAEWLVGPVDRLVADWDHKLLPGVEVEDTVHALTRHGRVMGCFSLNQHQAPNESTLTVICEGGTARFEYHSSRWRWMTAPGGEWHDEAAEPLERDTLFIRQAHAFLDALDRGAAPLCSLEEAAQTLCVNLAILASGEKQQWQSLKSLETPHE